MPLTGGTGVLVARTTARDWPDAGIWTRVERLARIAEPYAPFSLFRVTAGDAVLPRLPGRR
jgi:hypothetical protein